jgi:hypothetical protein
VLFDAGEHALDIRITPSDKTWVVCGQVLGPGEGGGVEMKELSGAAQTVLKTELNEMLEFTLPPAEAGKYQLILRLDEVELMVPELELSPL